MKEVEQKWKLRFGNKGIIFTMDAVVALLLVIALLTASYFYLYKSNNVIPNLSVLRTGDDIMALLDYGGYLSNLNQSDIQNVTSSLLSNRHDIFIKITTSNYTSPNQTFLIGNTIPNDRFVGSGKRFGVITNATNATFITSRYWVWLK